MLKTKEMLIANIQQLWYVILATPCTSWKQTNVGSKDIKEPVVPLSLRLHAVLLVGIAHVFLVKTAKLHDEVLDTWMRLRGFTSSHHVTVDLLPQDQKGSNITLPNDNNMFAVLGDEGSFFPPGESDWIHFQQNTLPLHWQHDVADIDLGRRAGKSHFGTSLTGIEEDVELDIVTGEAPQAAHLGTELDVLEWDGVPADQIDWEEGNPQPYLSPEATDTEVDPLEGIPSYSTGPSSAHLSNYQEGTPLVLPAMEEQVKRKVKASVDKHTAMDISLLAKSIASPDLLTTNRLQPDPTRVSHSLHSISPQKRRFLQKQRDHFEKDWPKLALFPSQVAQPPVIRHLKLLKVDWTPEQPIDFGRNGGEDQEDYLGTFESNADLSVQHSESSPPHEGWIPLGDHVLGDPQAFHDDSSPSLPPTPEEDGEDNPRMSRSSHYTKHKSGQSSQGWSGWTQDETVDGKRESGMQPARPLQVSNRFYQYLVRKWKEGPVKWSELMSRSKRLTACRAFQQVLGLYSLCLLTNSLDSVGFLQQTALTPHNGWFPLP